MANAVSSGLRIVLLSPEPSLAESFIATVGGREAELSGVNLLLDSYDVDTAFKNIKDLNLSGAHAVLMIVRHLDADTIARIRAAHARLEVESRIRPTFVIYRMPNESDFKISCPTCNQRLLVRDQDVNRMATCPHCKNALRLPLPDMHLRTHLNLSKSHTVVPASAAKPESCRHVFSSLVQHSIRREEELKKASTMRIVLPPS